MIGEIIQMRTENLTYIIDNEQSGQFRAAVVIQNTEANQKLSENYIKEITATQSLVSFKDLYSSWIGIDKGFKYINWTVPPNYNITINHLMNFNQEPYAYIDEETGEKAGLLPQIAQILSSRLNAKNTFLETNSQKDYIPAVKNGTANITAGYFLNSELNDDELIVINTSMPSNTSLVIRYDNAEGSKEWAILNTINDFDGENIGIASQYEQDDTVKTNIKGYFSNSNVRTYSNINYLFTGLVKEDIEGAVVDINAVNYYLENSDRIDYYTDNLFNNSYGILFKSEDVKNKFNTFLEEKYDETQRTSLFNEWKNADTEKTIDYNTAGETKLFVSFVQSRPISYFENFRYKGYAFALLEEFAANNGYSLIVNTSSIGYSDESDIILGYQNITGEKAGDYFFSDPILTSYSVLAVRKDGKRENLPLTALNENYTQKADNKLDIPIKIGNQEAVSQCQLPSTFSSDVITLECTASGLSRLRNLADENIEFGEITDRINILYSSIKADNLMKANEIFPGENITNIGDVSTDSDESYSSSNSTYKKSSSGLSTGGIIGVTIPCCVVLAAVTGLAFAMKGSAPDTVVGTEANNSSVVALQAPTQNVNVIPNTGNNIILAPVTNPV